jgi:polar amino acid transport system substrate-binding protein
MNTLSRSRRRILVCAALLALTVPASACTNNLPSSSSGVDVTFPEVDAAAALVPETIRDAGVLRVAIPTNEPPTQFYREGTQEMTGVNPEMAGLVAGALGLEIEVHVANFDAIIPGIDAGRYDMTVSSMTPTDARMVKLDFVDYIQFGSSLAVPKGNPKSLGFDTLCGQRVAVLTGSYQLTTSVPPLQEACSAAGAAEIEINQFQDTRQAISSMLSGRTDVVYADQPVLSYAVTKNPDVELADTNDVAPVAIGTLKGTGLDEAIAVAMGSILPSEDYQAVLARYGLGPEAAIKEARVNFAQ